MVCVQKNVENLQGACTILGKNVHLKTLFEMLLAIEIVFFLPGASLKPNSF